ncbi:MAG: tetratricopeptide repeat protein [Pseudanabaenaceae cyanobacterium SKYGB_i_bin29]|nr:tetratricopeptide repeat protein [Pseudanabaenaceae cyanobacterium SKYG29]MDW8421490.1 tetratricopeptide repeat protein [Pseudanabaenaceae cyanobacterium SKYGB_i_bin29]
MRLFLVVGLWLLCFPWWGEATTLVEAGIQALQSQQYARAVEIFSQTIDQAPALSYGNRCLAYLLLGIYDKAERDCDRALEYLPDNAEVWLDRGLARFHRGNYPGALADFDRGIALDPHNYRLFYDRALVYSAMGQSHRSLTDYEQALRLSPPVADRVEILTDRGIELMLGGQLEGALLDFQQATHLMPSHARAWFHQGCAHQRQGELDLALADFDRVLHLEPENPEAYRARAIVQKQRGKLRQAVTDLEWASFYFQQRGQQEEYTSVENLKFHWLVRLYV